MRYLREEFFGGGRRKSAEVPSGQRFTVENKVFISGGGVTIFGRPPRPQSPRENENSSFANRSDRGNPPAALPPRHRHSTVALRQFPLPRPSTFVLGSPPHPPFAPVQVPPIANCFPRFAFGVHQNSPKFTKIHEVHQKISGGEGDWPWNCQFAVRSSQFATHTRCTHSKTHLFLRKTAKNTLNTLKFFSGPRNTLTTNP
jgi:hypothetical protein